MAVSSSPLSRLPGAERARKPEFIEPCLATSTSRAPPPGEWSHEIKYDGYRVQAHFESGRWTLRTRRGFDWTPRFSSIARALTGLRVRSAILDGEIYVPDPSGRSDFHLLESDLAKARTDRFVYCVFDLLYLDGYDLRACALQDRRRLLRELIGEGRPRLLFSAAIDLDSSRIFEQACAMNLEGVVSKRLDAPYRSGEQASWLKRKCRNTETAPIIAFVEKLGARPRRIASLYLGRYENGQLLYAGKAQTGFKNEQLYQLRERLDPYIRPTSPLSVPIDKPKATWVEPVVLAEVEFSSLTQHRRLRQPIYKGLRDDLMAERGAVPATRSVRARLGRNAVPRENILQLLPDAVSPTHEALTAYWQSVHPSALPYLARRPLKLVRHVHGTTFYHKGPLPPVPRSVHQLTISKRSGGEGTRLWVDDLDGLLALVEMGAVELHPWNSRVDDIEHADTMVFDLDPGEGVGWTFVVDAAFTLRELLSQEGYDAWPKLTGGKGIHLMVPLPKKMTHDAAHGESRRIAELLTRTDTDRFTTSAALSSRPHRLFVDYLRNGRGTTAVGTYSPRARPGHPIAAPVSWQNIEAGVRPDHFKMDCPPAASKRSPSRRTRKRKH